MIKSKSTISTGQLETMIENLEGLNTHHAEIGIYGGTEPNGGSLVTVARTHEFGGERMPARPFLSYPIILYKARIEKVLTKQLRRRLYSSNGWKQVLLAVCYEAEDIVSDAFDTGGFGAWQRLQPITISRKNSEVILIHTGHLRRSVQSKVEKND